MPRLYRLLQHPIGSKVFLCLLLGISLVYVVAVRRVVYPSVSAPSATIVEHSISANPGSIVQYWTKAQMASAIDSDLTGSNTSDFTQGSTDTGKGQATRQEGQPPSASNAAYPLSTVGKIFFTDSAGRAYVCSGTAVVSLNHSVVDTAGHCLYWQGSWMQNVIFCPLYANGDTPYGCWAARDLEAPSEWINAQPNDYHHDLGMAVVSPNSQGDLTDIVGGAGWAYNQAVSQPYSAYGYPAAYPFDGQTRQSCESPSGQTWQHAGGTVVSIPCNMTGGSSGGPWFIKSDGNWYLSGHNDFTSSIQPGHMFSPYYDDTWSALYDTAQHA